MVQNMTWSGAYLRITFSFDLPKKILKMVPLTATGPEVYIATMTNILSNSYDYLVDALNHMKILKLKDRLGVNVADCFDNSAEAFKPDHLGYIIRIF